MCECLRQAPEAQLALSALGSSVRALVKRRGLLASDSRGKLTNLSLAVKGQWGSWQGFAQARAADGLQLQGDVMSCRPKVDQMCSDDGRAPAPRQAAVVPSRDEVNSLALDAL